MRRKNKEKARRKRGEKDPSVDFFGWLAVGSHPDPPGSAPPPLRHQLGTRTSREERRPGALLFAVPYALFAVPLFCRALVSLRPCFAAPLFFICRYFMSSDYARAWRFAEV